MILGVILGIAVLAVAVYGIKWYQKKKEEKNPSESSGEKKSINKKSVLSIAIGLGFFAVVIMANLFIPHSLWLSTKSLEDYLEINESEKYGGTNYENYVDDDQLVLTGFMDIIKFYKLEQKNVIIPAKKLGKYITAVGANAFKENKNIKTVKFNKKSQVKIIAGKAFDSCINLTEITIPSSVKVIGSNVFRNCTSLKTLIYDGTYEEWSKVAVAFDAFSGLSGINIVCSDKQAYLDFNRT